MIRLIQALPDNVAGFRACDRVTGRDYEDVIIPILKNKLIRHDKINVLYHTDTSFAGFTATALWKDSKIGLRNWRHWNKVAVVSDKTPIRTMVKVFAYLLPKQVRLYSNDQLNEAREWVTH